MKITDIVIKDRTRQELGNIQALADSIKEIGLLNPITIYYDEHMHPVLLAGYRRLKAFELLQIEDIPARPIDINNTEQKNV